MSRSRVSAKSRKRRSIARADNRGRWPGGRGRGIESHRNQVSPACSHGEISREAREGQQKKIELVCSYLTGPQFRHRMDAIFERFTSMRDDLGRERETVIRLKPYGRALLARTSRLG